MGDNNVANGYQYQPTWAASTSLGSADDPSSANTAPQAKSANPEKLALAFLSQMSDVGSTQYGGTQGAQGVAATQGTHAARGSQGAQGITGTQAARGGQGARFAGQSFSASMPPPSAPKVQFNSSTQASFQSFAAESKAAMQSTGAYAAQQPALKQSGGASLIKPGSNTMDQVSGDAASWLSNNAMGAQAFANGGLYAFMKLRMENTDKSINAMQGLAGSASDLQSTMAEQQVAQADAAQKEAQKSQKKAGMLGIFQKVFAVILAVVLVVVACLTCQPELAALGIAMAAAAFATAGAVKGAKNGSGFDFWGGLDWFNNVAGLAGLSAILTSAAKAGMQVAMKGVETSLKSGAEASGAVTSGAEQSAARGSMFAEEGADDAASTQAATAEAASGGGGAAAQGGAKAQSASAQLLEEQTRELRKVENAGIQAQQASKNGADVSAGKWGQFKSAMGANMAQATGCKTLAEYGTMQAKAGATIGLTQGADQMGSAVMQLNVSRYQANSDEDMAHFAQLKSMVKMLDSSYKTANDLVQTLIKSHSGAVDQVQSMLKGNNDVQNMIATNMSQI